MSDVDEELAERARTRVGQTLCGKYRIERVLGVGGMAFVYVATHRNGRRVAIKMLHPELSIRADLRKRFLLEGHAANAVNHPGAVVVIDDDVADDGAAFLVMELLEGHSVEELWHKSGGALSAKTVLGIGRELCDVLAAAHAVGIVHRDIKPANLFVTTDGRLKVLDFGLARVRDATTAGNATATGLVFGTPAFLPPEQAAGRMSQIDARTDLWAVGATMFTLLTGKTVHEGESAQNLVVLAATTPPRSLATLLPDADPAVVRIVDRALDFDRDARWSSAREMHEAICAASSTIVGDPSPELAGMSDIIQAYPTTPAPGASAPRDGDAWPLGMRTSRPVSSSAPTQLKVRAPLRLVQRVVVAVRSVAASIPMSTIAWKRRATLAAFAGLALAIGVVTVLVRVVPTSPASAPSSSAATPPEADSDPQLGATASAGETIASADPALRTVSSSSAVPANRATSPTKPGRRGSGVVRPVPAPPPKPAPEKPAPTPEKPPEKPAPDCATKFYLDSTGKKVWKPECFQRGPDEK